MLNQIEELRETIDYNQVIKKEYHWVYYTGHDRVADQFGKNIVQKMGFKKDQQLVVADLGCSKGLTTVELAAIFGPNSHIIGLDISSEILDKNKIEKEVFYNNKRDREGYSYLSDVKLEQIDLTVGDAYFPPFPKQSIDIVFAMNNLYQVLKFGNLNQNQLTMIFENISEIIKPGGFLCLSGVFDEDFDGNDLSQSFIFQIPRQKGEPIKLIQYQDNFPENSPTFSYSEAEKIKDLILSSIS